MAEKFISIEGIAKRYPAPGGATTTIFEDLWLSMPRGEFGCVIGHSGLRQDHGAEHPRRPR